MKRRIGTLALLTAATGLFFALGLQDFLSLDIWKERRAELVAIAVEEPVLLASVFILMQASAVALSIPGAVLILSLAGGAIFDPFWGTVIVLTALTIGNSVGFIIARYLLRDWVQGRFGRHLRRIGRGVEEEGPFFLLALRLMAVVPYFIVNVSMALTRMPLRMFAPVSLLGVVPATILYVNAGTMLGGIDEPSDILSPRLIGWFILLALLPIAARFLFRRWTSRDRR